MLIEAESLSTHKYTHANTREHKTRTSATHVERFGRRQGCKEIRLRSAEVQTEIRTFNRKIASSWNLGGTMEIYATNRYLQNWCACRLQSADCSLHPTEMSVRRLLTIHFLDCTKNIRLKTGSHFSGTIIEHIYKTHELLVVALKHMRAKSRVCDRAFDRYKVAPFPHARRPVRSVRENRDARADDQRPMQQRR